MRKKARVRFNHLFHKIHGYIGIVIAFFILWMVIWGVILSNREPIREISHHFDNYAEYPEYSLDFPKGSISVDDALKLGWEALGKQEKISRIELKWESGAPIYRIRFKDKGKSEVTIHALKGDILLLPSKDKELKKIAQDMHEMRFLPKDQRWIFDMLGIIVIITISSGIVILFMGKMYSGTLTRKIHIISSGVAAIPFLMMAITGFALNHEEWLESYSKTLISSSPMKKPSLDFSYDSLPVTPVKAVEIFQKQFLEPRELRRVVLKYNKEAKALVWNVEPNDGMRITSIVDAHTGEIIKSSDEIQLVEYADQLHELFLFGKYSKYVVDVVGIAIVVSLMTGWMLTFQMVRRRWYF